MDYVPYFQREVLDFAEAVRRAVGQPAAPPVPSCPGWRMGDLAVHLGGVHRFVHRILTDRLAAPPDTADLSLYELPADLTDWPMPDKAPNHGPVREVLVDWFEEGAARLTELFRDVDPALRVWTWHGPDQSAGFWLRMQTIEAALHRWDAEHAFGEPRALDPELAADAIPQTFEVMAPARRAWTGAPAARGERFTFRRTDGPGAPAGPDALAVPAAWTVTFTGDEVTWAPTPPSAQPGPDAPEFAGPASDLALFLWNRVAPTRLAVTGEDPQTAADRYFGLVPPV